MRLKQEWMNRRVLRYSGAYSICVAGSSNQSITHSLVDTARRHETGSSAPTRLRSLFRVVVCDGRVREDWDCVLLFILHRAASSVPSCNRGPGHVQRKVATLRSLPNKTCDGTELHAPNWTLGQRQGNRFAL